jgi:hypothetical protein
MTPAMYSRGAIGLFGAVKTIFDPANVLNPDAPTSETEPSRV